MEGLSATEPTEYFKLHSKVLIWVHNRTTALTREEVTASLLNLGNRLTDQTKTAYFSQKTWTRLGTSKFRIRTIKRLSLQNPMDSSLVLQTMEQINKRAFLAKHRTHSLSKILPDFFLITLLTRRTTPIRDRQISLPTKPKIKLLKIITTRIT
jgi:hypothetical protein